MKAIILAAGKGTRLARLTRRLPKPMIRVHGAPILEHAVRLLRRHGITQLMINVHHYPSAITGYFRDGARWRTTITYSYEDTLLGTAGAVKKVETFFDAPFLVYYGDNVTTIPIASVVRFHRHRRPLATVVVFPGQDQHPELGGVVHVDRNARIRAFLEKPEPGRVRMFPRPLWINAGVYVLDPSILTLIPDHRPADFASEVFPRALARGLPLAAYRCDALVRGVDTPERLRAVRRELAR